MFRLVIYTIFVLVLAVCGELASHNDTSSSNVSNTKDCCVHGRYDKKRKSCVGSNDEEVPFVFPCRSVTSAADYLSDDDDPEEIER